MIEQLFGSKTRVKLLRLFFSNPNRSFYVREITRKIDEQINSVRRELANLLSMGLISSDSTNNKLYYEVNQDYEHYKALQSMFAEKVTSDEVTTTEKSTKTEKVTTKAPAEAKSPDYIELPEAKQWTKVGNVSGVAYSGAYTRDDNASVDILIIGDVTIPRVESVIVGLEREKSRELRYAVMEPHEWWYRRQVRDKFWQQFMSAKKLVVLDKDNYFSKK